MESNIQKYNITNIFYSIQGEGFHSGKPAIFIRFSQCNLKCRFCDEPSQPTVEYDSKKIISKINKFSPCKFVVLTGGEPSIQSGLEQLITKLKKNDFFVSVETNGTNIIKGYPDWITVSPKTDDFYYGDELKLVYDKQNIKEFEHLPFKHFYIQPMNLEKDIDFTSLGKCIKLVKDNPKWKLSIQLHKFLRIS